MRPQSSTVEMVDRRMAARSHGVVTRAQLLAAGITGAEIKWRLRTGALLREHPGVYRVGHRAPSVEARYLAAVWACGDGAVLSGRAAAHLWGILKGAAPRAGSDRAAGSGGSRASPPAGRGTSKRPTHRGIPITTVPRTLVDLAAHLSLDALARACHEAGVKYDTTPSQVDAVLRKAPDDQGRREPPGDPQRRRPRDPERARTRVPGTTRRRRPPTPQDQQTRPRPPRRLPLARATA